MSTPVPGLSVSASGGVSGQKGVTRFSAGKWKVIVACELPRVQLELPHPRTLLSVSVTFSSTLLKVGVGPTLITYVDGDPVQ